MRLEVVRRALLVAGVLVCSNATASEYYDLTGFVAPEIRMQFDGGVPSWLLSSAPDARINLRVTPSDQVEALITGDLDIRYGEFDQFEVRPQLREGWARLYPGDFTLTLGRQIYSWGSIGEFGVADVLNPQELFDTAQNWAERKRGVWSFRADWVQEIATFEMYLIPVVQTAALGPESPWLDPRLTPAAGAASLHDLDYHPPDQDLANTQGALRVYFSLDAADVAVGVAHLLDHVGSVGLDRTGTPSLMHGKWDVFTAEASVPFLEGYSIGLESAWMMSEDDVDGTARYMDNARLHAAMRIRGFLTPSLQFEWGGLVAQTFSKTNALSLVPDIGSNQPFGNPYLNLEDRLTHLSFIYRFGDAMHGLSITYLTALDDNGHYINPAAAFRLLNGILLDVGAQVYGGAGTSLGAMQEQSNIYTSLRADF